MHPFADQESRKPGARKLILLALAVASFSIWYFDLMPELAPVPTGSLEADSSENVPEDDFLALLNSPPDNSEAPAEDGEMPEVFSDDDSDASLLQAISEQTDPLEADFPELAAATGEQPPVPSSGNIAQASFEREEPAPENTPVSKVLPPEVAELLRNADSLMEAGDTLEAHAALSRLYWKQPSLRKEIQSRIERTAAEIYANPRTHFADPYMVRPGDTLSSIAQEYKVPWQYLARLNRTNAEQLQAGQKLKVLTGPFGAVVDLDKFELTIHAHGWFVRRYRIGIGADGKTPPGEYTIQEKLENPVWFSPDGGQVAADDPSNPLGEYWLGLGNHLGIHGTIDPNSIGSAASRGCIHLADDDIAEIFQLLGVGSTVTIRR